MSYAEFWRDQEQQALTLAAYYERIPEDTQKAAGAKEMRRLAEVYHQRAEEAEREEANAE